MTFIAHDIVTLDDSQNIQSFQNYAYLNKAFSKKETAQIHSFPESALINAMLLWTHKEAAYKIFLKSGLNKAFSPKMYQSEKIHFSNGLISYSETSCDLLSAVCESRLFDNVALSTASDNKSVLKNIHIILEKTDDLINKNNIIRNKLIIEITKKYGHPISRYHIKNNSSDIPQLYISNKNDKFDISFSYDTDYISAAYLYLNDKHTN